VIRWNLDLSAFLASPAAASWGALAASVLVTFERATDRRIVEHLDLITGTSTGGIIAIGLAMGATAILDRS
jgi:patatin-like phospholipase/acyl hydrolase